MNLLLVNHGIDNFEEGIDLDEIIFFRSSWSPPEGSQKSGTNLTDITFKNGFETKVGFNDKGYEVFLKALKNRSGKTQRPRRR